MAKLKFDYGSKEYAYYLNFVAMKAQKEIPRDSDGNLDPRDRTDRLLYASVAWMSGLGGAEPILGTDKIRYVYGGHVWNDITVDDVIDYLNAVCEGYEGRK